MKVVKIFFCLALCFLFMGYATACAALVDKVDHEHMASVGNMIVLLNFNAGSSRELYYIDPVLSSFIAAIASKSAPILVNKQVWNVFAQKRGEYERYKTFLDPEELDETAPLHGLYNLYQQMLNKNAERIISVLDLAQSQNKSYDEVSSSSSSADLFGDAFDQHFSKLLELSEKQDLRGQAAYGANNMVARYHLIQQIAFSIVPFDPREWVVYEHDFFYLLMPLAYAQKRGALSITNNSVELNLPLLGLKMAHMKRVDISDTYELPQSPPSDFTTVQEFLQAMNDVFYSTNELSGIPSWLFFFIGHGLPCPEIEMLDLLANVIEREAKELGVLYSLDGVMKLAETFKGTKKGELAASLLGHAMAYEELIINSTCDIAGLRLKLWRAWLNFCEHNVKPAAVVTLSCYGGKTLAKAPFNSLSVGKKLSFKLISLTTNEMLAYSAFPLLDLLSKPFPKPIIADDTKPDHKPMLNPGLTIRDGSVEFNFKKMDFEQFFDCLNAQQLGMKGAKGLDQILSYLGIRTTQYLASERVESDISKPSAKIVPTSGNAFAITQTLVQTKDEFKPLDAKFIVLYTNYMPQLVYFGSTYPILIVETFNKNILFEDIRADSLEYDRLFSNLIGLSSAERNNPELVGINSLVAMFPLQWSAPQLETKLFKNVVIEKYPTMPDAQGYIYAYVWGTLDSSLVVFYYRANPDKFEQFTLYGISDFSSVPDLDVNKRAAEEHYKELVAKAQATKFYSKLKLDDGFSKEQKAGIEAVIKKQLDSTKGTK